MAKCALLTTQKQGVAEHVHTHCSLVFVYVQSVLCALHGWYLLDINSLYLSKKWTPLFHTTCNILMRTWYLLCPELFVYLQVRFAAPFARQRWKRTSLFVLMPGHWWHASMSRSNPSMCCYVKLKILICPMICWSQSQQRSQLSNRGQFLSVTEMHHPLSPQLASQCSP